MPTMRRYSDAPRDQYSGPQHNSNPQPTIEPRYIRLRRQRETDGGDFVAFCQECDGVICVAAPGVHGLTFILREWGFRKFVVMQLDRDEITAHIPRGHLADCTMKPKPIEPKVFLGGVDGQAVSGQAISQQQ